MVSCKAADTDLKGKRPETRAHFSFLLVDSHDVSGGVIDWKKVNSSILDNPTINRVFSLVRKQIYGKGSDGINGLIWPVYANGVHQRAIRIEGDRTDASSSMPDFPAFSSPEARAGKQGPDQKEAEKPAKKYVFPPVLPLSGPTDAHQATLAERIASFEKTANPKSALLVASSRRSPNQELLLVSSASGRTTWSLIDQFGSLSKSGVQGMKPDRISTPDISNASSRRPSLVNPLPAKQNPEVDFSCALFSGSNLVECLDVSSAANKNALLSCPAFAIPRKEITASLKAASPWFFEFFSEAAP